MGTDSDQQLIYAYKAQCLDATAAYRESLYREPQLRQIFLELTLQCNQHCFHCGSRCDAQQHEGLSLAEYRAFIDRVKADFGTRNIQFCLTGGEPLLRSDFFELADYLRESGFCWGMTTNATLITPEVAQRLKAAGMNTVSVSIDGLEQTHDAQRGMVGGYRRAMAGIQHLIDAHFLQHLQVTSIMNHANMDELDALYDIMCSLDIDSWRVAGIEPIGRALDNPDLLLTPDDQRRLLSFIKAKREAGMPVCYGCGHFLGLEYERDVRDWFFLCAAGLHVASIDVDGGIRACLDIEKTPLTAQGNVRTHSFAQVWHDRFELFRQPLSGLCASCEACPHDAWCAGGAHHSFDYACGEQRICLKDVLF